MKAPKNISGLSPEATKNRLQSLRDEYRAALANVDNLHVFISGGNRKTGVIPSVSLLPILNCPNCKYCQKLCYDFRNDIIYKETRQSRARNAAILAADPERYFREISYYLAIFRPRFFRWHIGGDIVNAAYLAGMVQIAKQNPDTIFLAFTKCFDLVNEHNDEIPSNLQIVFSAWRDQPMENPYNRPTSNPRYADGFTTAPDGAIECGGNCTECAATGCGCWFLKAGEAVIFNVH